MYRILYMIQITKEHLLQSNGEFYSVSKNLDGKEGE